MDDEFALCWNNFQVRRLRLIEVFFSLDYSSLFFWETYLNYLNLFDAQTIILIHKINFYSFWTYLQENIASGFQNLFDRGDLVDVTLACDGKLLQAHKIVLAICSPYFQEMFITVQCRHPISKFFFIITSFHGSRDKFFSHSRLFFADFFIVIFMLCSH